jgi:predicted DNA-binding helix-hairpin-helix protein
MEEKRRTVRRLHRLADRVSENAETIRGADKPHQLTPARSRMARHMMELNKIRDHWSDTHKPTRRKKTAPHPDMAYWHGRALQKRLSGQS